MSDPRFASLKTDPRFRRPKKYHSKVVLDDRFKDLLGDEKKSKKNKGPKKTPRVDKYGRKVSETQEKEDLRRFYRLEREDAEEDTPIIDYARGAVLMESSDEDEADAHLQPDESGSDSDEDGFISLGADPNKPDDDEDDELEIDLDENTIATLDAQVAEYARTAPEQKGDSDTRQTRRLAVVNIDWDHVRAVHLYKIFSSLLSPTAPTSTSHIQNSRTLVGRRSVNVARGRLLSVRVYPSEFGKKRMAREEKEGPPSELFKKKMKDVEINEQTIFETGGEADYDEDALRKYQLERLRYFYAIVECDTVDAAAHVYNELEGTELERSANVFDLSFVPDDMTFDDEPRDEATQLSDAPYRAVEFVTDALRHSKVKLTWDEDDPERTHVLRRPLTKKEIEEADFRAYVASSSSGSEDDEDEDDGSKKRGARKTKDERKTFKKAERDKLRTLLLGGTDDELPEGWDNAFDNKANKIARGDDGDVDMEVTFTPGLSELKNPEEENTLERYQRKQKEKRKKKKDGDAASTKKASMDNEFFDPGSDGRHEKRVEPPIKQSKKKAKSAQPQRHTESSKAELALLTASDNPHGEAAHFDMKAVLKAEKQSKSKKSKRRFKKRGNDDDDGPGETQGDFVIDVKDDRFTAIHEDHQFAIDPTNPQFKKTKSMAALLDERSKRQKDNSRAEKPVHSQRTAPRNERSLQSLVESIKRKSVTVDDGGLGKRRKLGKT